ncbi:RNA polymerase II-associated protein 3, partial [Linum perenne]
AQFSVSVRTKGKKETIFLSFLLPLNSSPTSRNIQVCNFLHLLSPSMATAPSKHGRDQAMDFQGFLNDLQDWELKLQDKDKRLKPLASDKKASAAESSSRSNWPLPDYAKSIGSVSDESAVDATSEKELGNEYFKQKKFVEAIECYSRSIAFSPTAVAYANRAMAYIKIKRFREAEDDCTEALNLDDRYIKAYSRRATARKELGKLKESMEDSEFALRLEPNNQEIKKQYNDAKSLYEKKLFQKVSGGSKISAQPAVKLGGPVKVNRAGDASVSRPSQTTGSAAVQKDRTKQENGGAVREIETIKPVKVNGAGDASVSRPSKTAGSGSVQKDRTKDNSRAVENIETISSVTGSKTESKHVNRREAPAGRPSSESVQTRQKDGTQELKPPVHDLASRAASRAKAEAAKNITPPTSAYQFEASWRRFSGDNALQTSLLKVTPPSALPRIFKNALSAPVLIDIIKCVSTFFKDDVDLAVKYLENLTKVPRFSMLIMSLSTSDRTVLHETWNEVFCSEATPVEYAEILDSLRPVYSIR